jgi:hypothetical protein
MTKRELTYLARLIQTGFSNCSTRMRRRRKYALDLYHNCKAWQFFTVNQWHHLCGAKTWSR